MIARTLARRIVLRTTEPEAFTALRFLECDPHIAVERDPDIAAAPTDTIISVEPVSEGYQIVGLGKEVEWVGGLRSVIDRLHSQLVSWSLQALPRAGLLHAASLRRSRRRILLAGTQGAGKTTLALHLVGAGYALEGDEHVFVERDDVVARPRACRVKESSLALLPDLAQVIRSAPVYVDDACGKTFNFHPRMIHKSWRIERGDADCVFVLEPNHGGKSSLRSISPMAVAQKLTSEVGLRATGRGASIGAVAGLARRAQGFELLLGDHETALRSIESALGA